MRSRLPATETAPPNSTALVLDTIVKVCPNLGDGMSPDILILSAGSFRIELNPLFFDYNLLFDISYYHHPLLSHVKLD